MRTASSLNSRSYLRDMLTPPAKNLTWRFEVSTQLGKHHMGLHGFRHVPLVDERERPVGFISLRDIVNFIEENFAEKASSN
jgi:CBS domain-containing protein